MQKTICDHRDDGRAGGVFTSYEIVKVTVKGVGFVHLLPPPPPPFPPSDRENRQSKGVGEIHLPEEGGEWLVGGADILMWG